MEGGREVSASDGRKMSKEVKSQRTGLTAPESTPRVEIQTNGCQARDGARFFCVLPERTCRWHVRIDHDFAYPPPTTSARMEVWTVTTSSMCCRGGFDEGLLSPGTLQNPFTAAGGRWTIPRRTQRKLKGLEERLRGGGGGHRNTGAELGLNSISVDPNVVLAAKNSDAEDD